MAEYKYIFADPETFISMAMKHNIELVKRYIQDLQAKYPDKMLVIHFDSTLLRVSLHYNDIYEIMRNHFPSEVIICE